MSSKKKKPIYNSSDEDSESGSESEEESEEESEDEVVVDEETKQLNDLCERVYAYEASSEEDKLKNIAEYKEISGKIKEFEGVVKGYLNRQEELGETDYTPNKVTSNKTYTKCFKRYQELKNSLEDVKGFSVTELQDMFEELKTLSPKIKSYLDKQLEVIYL